MRKGGEERGWEDCQLGRGEMKGREEQEERSGKYKFMTTPPLIFLGDVEDNLSGCFFLNTVYLLHVSGECFLDSKPAL